MTERGQATVELALALPVVVGVVIVVVAFAQLAGQRMAVEEAARSAAHMAAVTDAGDRVDAAARSAAPGLDPARMTIETRRSGQLVEATVQYRTRFAPRIGPFRLAPVALSASASAWKESDISG